MGSHRCGSGFGCTLHQVHVPGYICHDSKGLCSDKRKRRMPPTTRGRCRSLHTTCVVCLLSVTTAPLASAQQPSAKTKHPAADQGRAKPNKAQSEAQRLKKAKLLFRKGNAMRKAGDCERALFFFRQSRQAMAGVPNIVNAALCLEELGRYDEALESLSLIHI